MRLTLRDRRWDPEKEKARPMWDRMNEAWRDLMTLVRVIDQRLTLKPFEFTGPLSTVTVAIASETRPLGVMLVSLYERDTNATSAVTFSWTWADGGLTTTSFSALPAGTYRATFLVIGGS